MPSTTGPAGKGGDQEAEQQAGRRAGVPSGPVQDPMIAGEPRLPAEPHDPQEAGHGALAGGEDGADQQQLGATPGPLLREHRRESQDEGGEAGWQV
jgi:hypothetical protein